MRIVWTTVASQRERFAVQARAKNLRWDVGGCMYHPCNMQAMHAVEVVDARVLRPRVWDVLIDSSQLPGACMAIADIVPPTGDANCHLHAVYSFASFLCPSQPAGNACPSQIKRTAGSRRGKGMFGRYGYGQRVVGNGGARARARRAGLVCCRAGRTCNMLEVRRRRAGSHVKGRTGSGWLYFEA